MERTNSLIVGAPRQGKTFFAESQLIRYAKAGGCSVVYNVGRDTDFQRFIPVQILTIQEYKLEFERKNRKRLANWELPKEVNYFKFKSEIYHLKDFSKMFSGKCVKIERVFNAGNIRTEDYFLASIYKYFYNTFIVFDDCRTIFRKGLSAEMVGLLSRVNHAGKLSVSNPAKIGVDIALVYHGFDTINVETYQFINLLVQFRTSYAPRTRIDNDELLETIQANFEALKSAKMYSHFEVDTMTGKNHLVSP